MRISAFVLIVCAFAFLFAFKDSQGLDQKKSVPSLFHHISRTRKVNAPNQIITAREAKPLTKCEKLRDEALGKMNQGIIGIYIPQCKADGSFEPMQCSGSTGYCWCVDKNGDKIPGTETPPGNRAPNCTEQAETKCEKLRAEALAKKKEGDVFVLVPECRADGSFNPVQCDQRFSLHFAKCWCVDENGEEIPGTEVTVGFGQDKLPNCDDKNPEKRHRLAGHRKTKLV